MKKKKEAVMTLAQWLVQNTDGEAYRAGRLSGWRHPKVDARLLEAVGGIGRLLGQARDLEKDEMLGGDKKIRFAWRDMGTDIRQIDYDITVIPELCRREGISDPREVQLKEIARIEYWREQILGCTWLLPYYDAMLVRLWEGKKVTEARDEQMFECLNAVAKQTEFVWERVFSSRVFNDSKKFKAAYRDRIFTILKKYSPHYVEGMEKDELFAMHEIHSYAQTLEWKGPLQYTLTEFGQTVDTAPNWYGTVLNSQTMEHAIPAALPGRRRIMTMENKANYEAMQYAEDTLYIFCHGYFTPKEARFLKGIWEMASSECEWYHWGDMDFGGICIFQFIKEHIFPGLLPYKMDAASFQEALDAGAGIMLAEETRQKLEKKDAGILNELKERILQTNRTIEQERLL